MKHANNIREKVDRADNAGATAKKAAEKKRNAANPENRNDRIVIGEGAAHAGLGGGRMVGPLERMAPFEGSKNDQDSRIGSDEVAGSKKSGKQKNSWIKGSSESKRMGGGHNVKGKL